MDDITLEEFRTLVETIIVKNGGRSQEKLTDLINELERVIVRVRQDERMEMMKQELWK